MRTPGVSRGTRNVVPPSCWRTFGLVRVLTKKSRATDPLAMKHFSPFRIHSSPCALGAEPPARAWILLGREPMVGAGVGFGAGLTEQERVVGDKRP